ncbi:MAG: hypothetical protein M1823_001411 [Watsoniomyces obsoletus]|nr:MAG: hypothetical protein M1823_001411 [Watsoniomyces obsoletus]
MKAAGILGLSTMLVALVAAVPLEKREIVMKTETFVEVVDVTTTVTLGAGQTPPTPTPTPAGDDKDKGPTVQQPPPAPSPASPSPTPTPPPPVQVQAQAQNVEAPPPPPSSSSSSSSTPPPAPSPEVAKPPPTYEAPKVETPKVETPKVETPKVDAGSSGPSIPGVPSKDKPMQGRIKHYTVGVGSCGWSSTRDENVVALPVSLLNSVSMVSNGHPLCGKTVTIKSPDGKTVQAKAVDKCMGCDPDTIDLSESLFEQFASLPTGVSPVTWYIN